MSQNYSFSLMMGAALICYATCETTTATAQETTPKIAVTSTALSLNPAYQWFMPDELSPTYGADGGALLSSIPGISASRMGGHGSDPIIHGQQQTQLSIINDGAITHGGCPNRMDPPTSFVTPDSFDSLTIIKGYQSVKYGVGGTGGTVIFEKGPVPFADRTIDAQASINGKYESNGQLRSIAAGMAAGNNLGQVRAAWSTSTANNYKDGNNTTVRSAFGAESFSLMPIWTPDEDTVLKMSAELNRTDDALYAGAGMDSPEGSALTHRINFSKIIHLDRLKKFVANIYSSHVDHVMDNYSLRTNTGMKMKAPSESDTYGGTIAGDFKFGGIPFAIGTDMQYNNRNAWRYSGVALAIEATSPQSRLWPNAQIHQNGIFVEATPEISEGLHLRAGTRYDYVTAEAKAAGTVFGSASPNALYLAHYGAAATKQREHNLSGLLRLEYDLSAQTLLFTGLSRSVRTADATERYMAANSGVASSRWIGNPNINPEKHNQFDIGISHTTSDWGGALSAYYDRVNDFIMRDLARGQDGIIATSNQTIYRNIDATLMGFEAQASYKITPLLTLNGDMVYTYGNNEEDNDALAQIPPLEGSVSLEYAPDIYTLGVKLNFATRQSQIDDQTSRRDVSKTSGYGTLDIYGSTKLGALDMRVGVTNLFDKQYAQHMNRSNAFDPAEIQVNEPGRSFGVQLHARF